MVWLRVALRTDGQLVFVDALGIVEQPPDQRGFAIVHAARGGEAQEFGLRGGVQPGGGFVAHGLDRHQK